MECEKVSLDLFECASLDCKGKFVPGRTGHKSCAVCNATFCEDCKEQGIERNGSWVCLRCFDFVLELGQAFVENDFDESDTEDETMELLPPRKRRRGTYTGGTSTSGMGAWSRR